MCLAEAKAKREVRPSLVKRRLRDGRTIEVVRMVKIYDLTGCRFGMLTVVEEISARPKTYVIAERCLMSDMATYRVANPDRAVAKSFRLFAPVISFTAKRILASTLAG